MDLQKNLQVTAPHITTNSVFQYYMQLVSDYKYLCVQKITLLISVVFLMSEIPQLFTAQIHAMHSVGYAEKIVIVAFLQGLLYHFWSFKLLGKTIQQYCCHQDDRKERCQAVH